jgi:hypothetical protein
MFATHLQNLLDNLNKKHNCNNHQQHLSFQQKNTSDFLEKVYFTPNL